MYKFPFRLYLNVGITKLFILNVISFNWNTHSNNVMSHRQQYIDIVFSWYFLLKVFSFISGALILNLKRIFMGIDSILLLIRNKFLGIYVNITEDYSKNMIFRRINKRSLKIW